MVFSQRTDIKLELLAFKIFDSTRILKTNSNFRRRGLNGNIFRALIMQDLLSHVLSQRVLYELELRE